MNLTILLAGGRGNRFSSEKPKQYIEIAGKPVIVYTLEAFQRCEEIDAIIIVCAKDWMEFVEGVVDQYSISKCVSVTKGGETSFDSLWNGLEEAKRYCHDNDVIVIHEAVRPFVTQSMIHSGIRNCNIRGNSVTAVTGNEALLYSDDGFSGDIYYDRSKLFQVQMPQFYRYSLIIECFEKANSLGLKSQSVNTLMVELGFIPLYINEGSLWNIKLTYIEDLPIFSYLLKAFSNEDII